MLDRVYKNRETPTEYMESPEDGNSLLNSFKYKGYVIVLFISTSIVTLSWVLEIFAGRSSSFNRIADPLLALCALILAGLLLLGKERVMRPVEWVGYVVIISYFLTNIYYMLYVYHGNLDTLEDLSTLAPWITMIYTLGYLMFGARNGFVASGLFYAALLGVSLPAVVQRLLVGEELRAVHVFIHIYFSGLVAISLLFILAYFTGAYSRMRALNEAVQRVANTDFLTGISNRRHLYEVLEQEVEEALQKERSVSLIMFDLDHFKRINDTHGHDVGDDLLKSVASLAGRNLRKSDQLGRWGGEEFLILTPETTLERAEFVADRLKLAIETGSFKGDTVTASFGVVTHRPGETVKTLLKRADEALYLAKENGRNRVETLG